MSLSVAGGRSERIGSIKPILKVQPYVKDINMFAPDSRLQINVRVADAMSGNAENRVIFKSSKVPVSGTRSTQQE